MKNRSQSCGLMRGLGLALVVWFAAPALAQMPPVPMQPVQAAGQPLQAPGQPPVRYAAVALHDVVDLAQDLDADAITSDRLVAFFDWLKGNGWQPISLDDIAKAQAGTRPLPDKPILLSFDDGYASLYTRVYPLALAYRFPVVAALVGSWMEVPSGGQVQYGDEMRPRSHFITWEQARTMQASGLVEFASHSDALHTSLLANRQGNRLPSASTRALAADGTRETARAQYARVLADLQRSRASMHKELGRAPRALVWPFGRYNADGIAAAQAAGFTFALTLQPSAARLDQPMQIARYWPSHNPKLADLVATITAPPRPPSAERLVCVNPAHLWNADPAVFDAQLGRAIERMRVLGATTAVVHALDMAAPATGADARGAQGKAVSAWFAAPGLDLRADALSRIAWQLRTRAGVQVVARLPHSQLQAAGLSAAQIEAVFSTLGAQVPWDGLLLEGGDSPATRSAFAAAKSNSPEMRRIWLAPPQATAPANFDARTAAHAEQGDFPDLVLYSAAQLAALRAGEGDPSRPLSAHQGLWLEDAQAIDAQTLVAQTRAFQLRGGTAIGWCPDDPLQDQPNAALAAPGVSAATFPLRF